MSKIEVGMLVECNLANLDQTLPKEKRTMFGYVVAMSDVLNEPMVTVAKFNPRAGFYRVAYYDLKDLQPLVVPMPEYAQLILLQMARAFKYQLDTTLVAAKKVRDVLKEANLVLDDIN